MNNQVVPFDFDQKQIRVVMREGEPWFVGHDVVQALGYANPKNAIKQHCKRAVVLFKSDLSTQDEYLAQAFPNRGLRLIPESDLYRLTLKSKAKDAERFQDWVCTEVLPSIRKHGGYIAGQSQLSEEELQQRAQQLAKSIIAEQALYTIKGFHRGYVFSNMSWDASMRLSTALHVLCPTEAPLGVC